MKIQCSCGAKYAFEVTPEMVSNPVRFVCPGCGADSSELVNDLIRREFAGQPADVPPPTAPPAPAAPRLKVAHTEPEAAASVEKKAELPPMSKYCPKHRRELVTGRCVVCQKPICGKCMELFGYVCSPLCNAKAEAEKIDVPIYAGKKDLVEARYWRLTGWIFGLLFAAVVLALGVWTWYAWIGSVPHPAFAVRFDERAYAGMSRLSGQDQIVFLHGGTLARYDLKTKTKIWSQELVSQQQIAEIVGRENQIQQNSDSDRKIPVSKIEAQVTTRLEGALQLHVSGQGIWVRSPGKLTQYDWNTGQKLQSIPLAGNAAALFSQGDEMLLVNETADGGEIISHINLATGKIRAEEIGQPGQNNSSGATALTSTGGTGNSAELPAALGTDAGNPMNPQKVAQQAQNLTLPARIALPALLANSENQERIQAELNSDQSTPKPSPQAVAAAQPGAGYYAFVPSRNGYIQFSVRLLESRIITREAMKAAPKKSALDGDLTVGKTADVANETLNEMQRNRGGDKIQEDESRYQVSIRRPDSTVAADWTGEVIGPPAVFSLKTVNVLAAGKTVIVLDKSNKKLWQAEFTYNIAAGAGAADDGESSFGAGPCVERDGTLYVFDQAVLTAFDLTTGNARWRLPSVGVVGLFFDDAGMLYVNTTTANPENVKYSREIDVTQKIEASLFKIDPKTGKTLWNVKPGGFISYLSGKFIYTVQFYDPGDEDASNDMLAGMQAPPFLRICRLNPKNGRVMWQHEQDRAPLDVRFDKNSIELVFKKEVQVLKYLSF